MTRFDELLDRYLSETISERELHEFLDLLNREDSPIKESMMQFLLDESFAGLSRPEKEEVLFNKIIERSGGIEKAKIHSIQKFWWVAASVVLVLGIGAFLYFNPSQKNQLVVDQPSKVNKDIAPPTSSHAIITLVNGEKIILDSAQNGNLAMQGNVNLVKLADGRLVYKQESTDNSQDETYNTLTNPRGSKVVSITLVDGTQVWLNAESSLTYPTTISGKERRVEITGEAYFEVAHNADKPFVVKNLAKNVEVTVLGTHFNMNTYDDEETIKVTLLEGSVRVKNENNEQKIKPGQQAQVSSLIKIENEVDLEEIVAWKNGWFNFNSLQIPDIMKQVSKWYNLDVVYEGNINQKHFTGIVSRESNVSGVLKIMEQAGIKFKIEGKNITVMQ
jgi:transmembrane sensor